MVMNMMGTITKAVVGAVLAALLVACASSGPFAEWDDRALAERVRAYARDGGMSPPPRSVAPESAQTPDTADVDWFINHAIAGNPQLRAARQRVERVRQRIPQARALPDPIASVTFGELAQTAAGQVEYIVGVQQSLPFPGTLDAREQVARRQVDEALGELQVTLQQVRGDVERAFWSYYAATREAEVLEQNRQLLKQIESSVNSRVKVAAAGQDDQLRVSRRLAAIENRISKAKQRQRSAMAMLVQLTGQGRWAAMPRPAVAERQVGSLDRDRLLQRAVRTNPAVRVAQARAATYRSRLELARATRLPDFMVGLNYGAVRASGLSPVANGDDQFSATVGVSIPIWGEQYDAAEHEALHGIGEAIAGIRLAQDRSTFGIDDALARLEANQEVLGRLRERMMPDARQTITVAMKSYQTGKLDLLQLLDDWDSLLDDQLAVARAIANVQRAAADVEQAVGGALAAPEPTP